ncbi:IMPACT family protein [Microbacterium sp.]|uniref:IMPACT family protein n=1 Tax=Microbacterium sp. TaxID=51671 RepID=UPI003C765491
MALSRRFPATIAEIVEHEIVIKRSRFLTTVTPVASPEEADAVVAAIRKRTWDAGHHCTAMITGLLGDHARSSDDGEPAGTAGAPMLDVLRRRGLTDVVAVVARYFGGVKLGAGGLVRAYSSAVSETLDSAALVRREALRRVTIEVSHADAGRCENLLRERAAGFGATLGPTAYGAVVTLELWVPDAELARVADELAAASAGRIHPIAGEERIVDVPL